MTQKDDSTKGMDWKEALSEDRDFLRPLVERVVHEVLEAEMDTALQAHNGERTPERLGYRSGYYERGLITRVGTLQLRVPQDRDGRFSTQVFERYQRSEKALVGALAEMYVQGVSTRKVKAVTEELCGHRFSASTISRINKRLDGELARFARRRLQEAYAYLILDARYEKVRQGGVIRSQAVLIARRILRILRDQLGRSSMRAGGGGGESGEQDELARVSAGAQGARAAWSGVRGERQP
jgi:putative transposase